MTGGKTKSNIILFKKRNKTYAINYFESFEFVIVKYWLYWVSLECKSLYRM